ncbi:MAG: Glutamate synthase (NADPH) large chain precursor [Syntrophorhabdaceae bacterium PtaU1.Bin034]|nr:MAG: Glutamate synthase (NADPH) large chain precursor [Syntrophorhabdaceae bacterium PtaU1.Bin034]
MASEERFTFPEIKQTPSRFRNPIGKYRVTISGACDNCGTCVGLCPYNVYRAGARRPRVINEQFCLGTKCTERSFCCITACPREAIAVRPNPTFEMLGDKRWTADLLGSTWHMAETGGVPHQDLNYKTGDTSGGFDKIRFVFPEGNGAKTPEESISTAIELNRTGDGRPSVVIPVPFYFGGMSFGSVSVVTMLSRVRAAAALRTFCCTGEGGYPDELKPYDDHIITQVATGLFGVREETIKRVRIVEFKYAQGAKPGLGGHLLGDKVTPRVAAMREAVPGSALFSPFPFHSVYSVEDHKKHVDWIKAINPRGLVSVKVSTPTDVDMVAVGSFYAGAHIIQLDGSYGGTGAAPDIAKKNIAMPIEYAVPKVHRFLTEEGIRDKITVIASGGVRNAWDMAKAIALGANGVCLGTADLVALECIRCHRCESGRGCARGIATTDDELVNLMDIEWGTQRIVNLYLAWHRQLVGILRRLGMKSVTELMGRTDVLVHLDYLKQEEIKGELA